MIGGDRRQAELARLLEEDGHIVHTYGLTSWKAVGASRLETAVMADVVVLPLPLCKEAGMLNCDEFPMSTMELFRGLCPGRRILAGQVKPEQQTEADACGLQILDYFQREDLAVANAAATAEAAIQTAMQHSDKMLMGMECLVLGFGRIGRLLSYRLHALGAKVTATARRPEDIAWIRAYGWRAIETAKLDGEMKNVGIVFNTIPALVLDTSLLKQLPENCLCVELASTPGIDLEAAEELGLKNVWARSLPGRLLPCTAAAAIRDAIYYMI